MNQRPRNPNAAGARADTQAAPRHYPGWWSWGIQAESLHWAGSRPPFPPSLLTAVPTERCLRNSRRRNERHSRSCLSWEEWGKECELGANLGNTVTSVIERDAPVGLARPFVPQTMHGHGPGPGTMWRWTRPGVSGRLPQQATEIW